MLEINGRQYRLAQLDTNVLSEMVKRPGREFANFVSRFFAKQYAPCASVFSVLELKDAGRVYERFLDYFSTIPLILLKGHEELLKEEIEQYPNEAEITAPNVTTFSFPIPEGSTRRAELEQLFEMEEIESRRGYWNAGKPDVLEGMLKLVQNFPPDGTTYSKVRVREFLQEASFQQLCLRAPDFVQRILDSGEEVLVDRFRSVKSMTGTVFYKFYVDKRRPHDSDVFDVIMAATLPYVDAVFTEGHQAEVITKMRRVDPFLDNLELYRLEDLR